MSIRNSSGFAAPFSNNEKHQRGKKQQELAEELGVPRTRISEVLNRKTSRFSADKLVSLLHRAGKSVEIRVS